jgi:hypothetical protein
MRGQLKDLHMLSTITQREEDWKTDTICNLLYCHPATTRSEIIFSIEESMKRVHMARSVSVSTHSPTHTCLSTDHPGAVVKGLLRNEISPLLETIFQRLSTPIPHTSSEEGEDGDAMDLTSSPRSPSPPFTIEKILKASVLLIATQLCHLFQLVGILESPLRHFPSHRKVQLIQRDFVERNVELMVDSLVELNIPIEVRDSSPPPSLH